MNQDKTFLGTEPIGKLLRQLAIPTVIAQLVNMLYNIVDRIYIGHIPGIGAAALTGVGLFAPILMLLNAFAMLVGSGGAPRAAIAMGKKDNALAEKILGNCFTLLVGLSIIEHVTLYSIMQDPMTSCGCFECICGIEPFSNGVVIANREYAGMTPLGMTFSEMASMTGGGVKVF